jgi:hypothetical protein
VEKLGLFGHDCESYHLKLCDYTFEELWRHKVILEVVAELVS